MLLSMKKFNIKNRPYYLFNDMINIKNFNPSLLGIVSANTNIYYIVYITMKSINI